MRFRIDLRLPGTAVLSAGLLTPLFLRAANPEAPADIDVSAKTVVRQVEPIGANLTKIMGGTNFAINNHVWSSGFEPIVWRKFVRINRAGENWIEWDGEGGPGHWNLAWTGLGNGATVRFYRIVDRSGGPLSYAGGTNLGDATGAHHVVFIGEDTVPRPCNEFPEGGYIVNDDRDGDTANNMSRVYLRQGGLDLRFGDYAYLKLKTNRIGPETSPPDLRKHYQGDQPFFRAEGGTWRGEIVPHPQPLPPDFTEPGETCLRATLTDATVTSLNQIVYYRYDDKEGQWYSQLHPEATYRVEVWMRQEGLGNGGMARFVFRNSQTYAAVSQSQPWVVTSAWQKFTYDFVAPPYPTDNRWHIMHGLEFTGPGQVWIDNFLLYRHDEEHEFRPFTPHAVSFDTLMGCLPPEGLKPAVRFYDAIYHPSSIEAMFTNYGNSQWTVAWNARVDQAPTATIAQALYWAYRSGIDPQTRVVPFLTCNEEYTEPEWMALAEFLGVPYDPQQDTPERKPYAYLRYRFRGNDGRPWTEEFREIVVEYGNESWHNGAGGYGWHGWGAPGAVHSGGLEYGLFARYMLGEQVMQMPAWKRYDLGKTIKFALNGNYTTDLATPHAYGEIAVQQWPQAAYVGHANYVGPKWETGDQGSKTFNDHGMQETMVATPVMMGKIIAGAAAARDTLRAGGIRYDVVAYEGGPSGYWQNKDNPEVDELYGKSVGMGLAALDAWLYSSLQGYKHQCYLGFYSGNWWSSHTPPEAGGFRPHIGWLAMTMRNLYARGDRMLDVTIDDPAPAYERNGQDIPLVAAYALADRRYCSVFILNRKLGGVHDGVDFGDGYTPVRLKLPFSEVRGIMLHRIAHPDGSPADPRENNRQAMNVTIVSQPIDTRHFSRKFVLDKSRGGSSRGIPPGGMYLYVFELR